MKIIQLLNTLKKYPIFNLLTIQKITKKDKPYSRLLIYRLKKKKLIYKIEKDKYTLSKDPFLIASRIIWPSYISCFSALRYYNLTEQLPQIIQIITTKKRRKRVLTFQKTKIKFITIKQRYFFGFNKVHYENFEIFTAEPEKALIDAALFKDMSFSEIKDILKSNLKEFNLNNLVKCLQKIKNKSLIKRFGYALSELNKDYYSKLRSYIDHNYVPLDYLLPNKGRKNEKWKILDNIK